MTATAKVLKKMMLEGCSRNLVDSGGAYGYQYEYRARRNLSKEPRTKIEWEEQKDGKLCGIVTRSMYHHLCETLEYDSYFTRRLTAYFKKQKGSSPYVDTSLWETFVFTLRGAEDVFSDNTYNHDSMLDGVFVYTAFTMPDDNYVILSTHNGCDVRWGYATPKVFRQVDEYSLFDYNAKYCSCEGDDCPGSTELQGDSGTCIYLNADMWSNWNILGKYWLRDGNLYCRDCRKEILVE